MISLCMIAKDEESMIAGCLKSVSGLVDEIIIVDTGSKDGTIGAANAAAHIPIKWIHHAWVGELASFCVARNKSIHHASGDWILVLDADERLNPVCFDIIKQVTQIKPEKAMAYSFKFKNLIDDNDHSKCVTHFVPRLYPNGLNICYKNIVHEQLIDRHNNNVPAVCLPDVQILHYGYLPSVMKEKEKHSRNLDMIHRSIRGDEENPFHYFNLGTTYRSAGDNQKAADAFRAVLRLADNSFDQYHYYQSSWVYLASCLLDMGMCTEAANVCLYVPETVHDIPDFWCVFGGCMLGLGRILAARIALDKCISMEKNTTVGISDRTCFDRAKKWLETIDAS